MKKILFLTLGLFSILLIASTPQQAFAKQCGVCPSGYSCDTGQGACVPINIAACTYTGTGGPAQGSIENGECCATINGTVQCQTLRNCTLSTGKTGVLTDGECCSMDGGYCESEFGNVSNPAPNIPDQNGQGFPAILNLVKQLLFNVIVISLGAVILYGGFLYMTAQGEPEQIKKAQSILMYSFIGMAVIALAIVIIRVVGAIIGVDVLNGIVNI